MNHDQNIPNQAGALHSQNQQAEDIAIDPQLREALSNFKSSVHAWSESAMSPRSMHQVAVRRTWRLASAWALGCVILAGGVSGGVYEQHRRDQAARAVAAARAAEHQHQLAAQQTREEEDLLAKVDSDISRQVPSAMEPLASLMTDEESKQ